MPTPHQTYRRYKGYDYSRGGAIFATFGLSPRRPIFGMIDHDHVAYSKEGEIAVAAIREAASSYCGRITLHRFVVMPDHVHLRLSWQAELPDPIKTIGAFVGRIKQRIHWQIAGHAPSIWESGYHDILCLSSRMNRSIDSYIANNPLKHWLMHCDKALMHVQEPFLLPSSADGEIWRAVGDTDILARPKLVAVRISRQTPQAEVPNLVARCIRGAELGYCFASTFYSPGERALFEALATKSEAPMVRLIPTFLDMAYRPHGREPRLFDTKRLLILSRMADPDADPTRPELLDLNAIAAHLAKASEGGKAVYWGGCGDGAAP